MCSTGDSAALPALGCPIRESTGQRLFSASPWLIAAVHALLRLLVPRHPPCALTILTVIRPGARPLPLMGGGHGGPGDTRFQPPLIVAADVASVQFSRTAERLITSAGAAGAAHRCSCGRRRTPVPQNSTACWTLRPRRRCSQVARRRRHRGHPARLGRRARPGRPVSPGRVRSCERVA